MNFIKLSQYYDLFISSASLLCGGILLFEGWRLDPILLLSQILSAGIAIFFLIESLYLRNTKYNKKQLYSNKNSNKTILNPPIQFQQYKLSRRPIIALYYSTKIFYYNIPLEYNSDLMKYTDDKS
jgi:hypothetical protein